MYITNLRRTTNGYTALVQKSKETKEHFLRYEISIDFNVTKESLQIQDGCLIGANEMVLKTGDNDILEHFFPGLSLQLVKETKELVA